MAQDVTKEIQVPAYLKASKVISYVVYFWAMFGIVVLSLRVFLLAFSANQTAGFVEFIYRTSADYMEPFRAIFPPKVVGDTGYFDVSAVFAIIIYLLFAWGVSALTNYIQSKIDAVNEAEKARERKLAHSQPDKK